jgi:tetratricopeptide (TPR) repeat protein
MPDLTEYEYDIFLSHNRADQEWTSKLAERLEQEDWKSRKLKVFFSPWDIRPGQSIPQEIERALPKSRRVGLVMSPDAIDSAWVELERMVTTYIAVSARDERLIPLYRRDCDIPALLRPILYVDFRQDATFEASYQTLLAVIRNEPLPRRSHTANGPATAPSPLIPRPPNVGFVARRDSEGRDIVERLQEELAPQKNQLIVLSGPGGVGKTTLAAEATRELSGTFGNRIVWTSALGREDFGLATLLDEIATQLGQPSLRTLGPEQKAEQVQALIATAAPLIILDNFETIAPTEQNANIQFLLNRSACPALVTTRQKIHEARNIIIPVMSSEEADDFLQRLIGQATDPSAFANLDRDRIIQAAERNPLVMQWVAGQIDLAQDARTVLEELAQGEGEAAQRVFDRSFALPQLGDDGRATLLALSLFAPDASRPVLADVAGFGEDVKRLNEAVKVLAALSLLKMTLDGSRLTVAGLTRELAKARLRNEVGGDAYRWRFVASFLNYAEAYSLPTAENYDVLEAERDNLLSAVDIAFELEDWGSVQVFAEILVNGMLYIRGYWAEAIRRGEQGLKVAKIAANDWYIGALANGLGGIFASQGNYASARTHYEMAVEIAARSGMQQGLAATLQQLASLARDEGDLSEARRLCYESLEIKKELNNQAGIAFTLRLLGVLAFEEDDFGEARRFYDESLEASKKANDPSNIASTLHQLAMLDQVEGHWVEARRQYDESLEIERKLGSQTQIASTLHQLGTLAQLEGDLLGARVLYHESLAIKKKLGDQAGMALSLAGLGSVAEVEGDKVEAAGLFHEALVIFEKLKSPNAKIARRSLERVEGKSS